MTQWIELAPAGLFQRRLQIQTNIDGLPHLNFKRHNRAAMTVSSNQRVIADMPGWTSMTVGGLAFQAKVDKLRLLGLVCPGLSLAFDWHCDDREGSTSVGVSSSRDIQEKFVVRKDVSMPIGTHTRARIEAQSTPRNVDLMIACLAYFWNYFEIDRITS
jgi:hypothetical protein